MSIFEHIIVDGQKSDTRTLGAVIHPHSSVQDDTEEIEQNTTTTSATTGESVELGDTVV